MPLLETIGWLLEAFIGCTLVFAFPVLTPFGLIALARYGQRRSSLLRWVAFPEWLYFVTMLTPLPLVLLGVVWTMLPGFLWLQHPLIPFTDSATWAILVGIPMLPAVALLLLASILRQ